VLSVAVAVNAPPTVTNTANVAGGGDVVATNNSASDTASVAQPGIFLPPLGIKRGSVVGTGVSWSIAWINNANVLANRVRVIDPIPAGSSFFAGSLSCSGTGATTVQRCAFNSAAGQIEVDAVIAPDPPSATTEVTANNELVISFTTNSVNGGVTLTNQARANWDLNGDGNIADELAANQTPVVTDDPNTPAGRDATSVAVPLFVNEAIPTLSPLGLLLLAIALGLTGMRRRAHRTS
jgi:uncharacterized repeat protein (TIGR01451 family)